MRLSKFHNMFSIGIHTFKNNIGLCIAYWAALLIFPLRSLASTNLLYNPYATPQEVNYQKFMSAYSIDSIVITALSLIFTTVVGFRAFSYLHNKRKTDYYGSLPISRTAHLLGASASLAVMAIVPLVFITFMSMMLAGFVNTAAELLELMGIQILAILANIVIIALLSVVSGSLAEVVVSFLMLNFGLPIIIILMYVLAGELPGNDGLALFNQSNGELRVNLPLVTAFAPIFAPYTVNKMPFIKNLYSCSLSSAPNTMFYIIWWSLFSVLVLALTIHLVRKRKAESAQSGFAYIQAREMIKSVSSIAGGLIGGFFVAGIAAENSHGTVYAAWFMFGCFLFSFLTEMILQLIYNHGFKEMPKFFINWGVSALLSIGSFVMIMSGMFGYVTRVPHLENIKSITVSNSEFNVYPLLGSSDNSKNNDIVAKDKDIIKTAVRLHKEFIDYAEKNTDIFYQKNYVNDDSYNEKNICFTYKLKDGSTIERYYSYSFGYDYSKSKTWEKLMTMDALKKLRSDLQKKAVFISSVESSANFRYAFMSDKYFNEFLSKYPGAQKNKLADGKISGLTDALCRDIESKGIIRNEENNTGGLWEIQVDTVDGESMLIYADDSYTETYSFLNSLKDLHDRGVDFRTLNDYEYDSDVYYKSEIQ